MSILQPSTILQGVSFGHGTKSDPVTLDGKSQVTPKQLRTTKSSIANLIQFVRHPVENVADALDTWWDGYPKEERARKRSLDEKKQILYLRLREV